MTAMIALHAYATVNGKNGNVAGAKISGKRIYVVSASGAGNANGSASTIA